MAIELYLSNGENLEFQPGLPNGYNGPLLRGAVAFFVKTNIAQLVIQEFKGDHYSIRFSIARFLKRVSANGAINKTGFYSYFMLKNGVRKEINTIGKLHVREDHYACLFTEPTECKVNFEKNLEYRGLDFFYSPEMMNELLPAFPELETLMTTPRGMVLPGKVRWINPALKAMSNQFFVSPYDDDTRRFYFDLKVREILYQLLETAYETDSSQQTFTPFETARIYEAKKILEGYVDKKPPSLRSLAKSVSMNEFKLKNGFRYYFQIGMFEWLIMEKMKHAKHLLLTTNMSIQDIGILIGYPRTTSFITAFRRIFKMTPGSLRRK